MGLVIWAILSIALTITGVVMINKVGNYENFWGACAFLGVASTIASVFCILTTVIAALIGLLA